MPLIWALAIMVVSYALESIVAKKAQPPKAATFNDFTLPQYEDGTPIPVVFGDCWIHGAVLWYGNLRTVPIHATGK